MRNVRPIPAITLATVMLLMVARWAPVFLSSLILVMLFGGLLVLKLRPLNGWPLLIGLIVLVSSAPWLVTHSPYNPVESLAQTPLGLDTHGRDYYSRLLYGHRQSLVIALLGSALATLFGCAIGGCIATGPRWLRYLGRLLVRSMLALPLLLLVLVALTLTSASPHSLALLFGLTLWPETARMVQAKLEEMRAAPFIEAAQMLGLRGFRLFWQEYMPNFRGVLLIAGLLTLLNGLLLESILGFLGLGLSPDTPGLGRLLEESVRRIDSQPLLLPAVMAFILGWIGCLRTLLHQQGARKSPLRVQ